jgi:hypothetical protein
VTVGGDVRTGTGIALWIGLGLALAGAVVPVILYRLGGARPEAPQLKRFMGGEGPAWYSPRLLAATHRRATRMRLAESPVQS